MPKRTEWARELSVGGPFTASFFSRRSAIRGANTPAAVEEWMKNTDKKKSGERNLFLSPAFLLSYTF